MADTKTSQLTQLAATPDVADLLMLVDVSDTAMAATGTNKRVAASYLARSDAGAGLIAGNGLTLTLWSSGTACVRGGDNQFAVAQTVNGVQVGGTVAPFVNRHAAGYNEVRSDTQSLANNGTYNLPLKPYGLVLVLDRSNGYFGLFWCLGNYNTNPTLINARSNCTATKDAASSVNFYWDAGAGAYVVQNKTGVTINVAVQVIGVLP